jgi:hypothetical protein
MSFAATDASGIIISVNGVGTAVQRVWVRNRQIFRYTPAFALSVTQVNMSIKK